MKLSAAFLTFTFASCTLAAPVLIDPDNITGQLDVSPSEAFEGELGSLGAQVTNSAYPEVPETASKPDLSDQAPLSPDWDTKPPFLDSSILREETRANVAESEPEATIVEMETKASSESYTYVPCMSQHGTKYYHRVRKHTDVLVVGIVLSFVAIVLLIELWNPICQRIYRSREGRGPIYLEDEESKTTSEQGQHAMRQETQGPKILGTPI
ncbi:hypothetical protein F5X99DRAFT_180467 [Biscogniauxia marginata]|nr:hypothetical protein F5X99DRAFT_180467 [Biscogniauxia marginata]